MYSNRNTISDYKPTLHFWPIVATSFSDAFGVLWKQRTRILVLLLILVAADAAILLAWHHDGRVDPKRADDLCGRIAFAIANAWAVGGAIRTVNPTFYMSFKVWFYGTTITLLYMLGTAIGLFLLIAPGIFVLGRFALASTEYYLDGRISPTYSGAITRGAFWKTFGLSCVILTAFAFLVVVLAVPISVADAHPMALPISSSIELVVSAYFYVFVQLMLLRWTLSLREAQSKLLPAA